MPRQVLALDLKDESVVEMYRDYHGAVWPEVLDSLRDSGVVSMEIYLLGQRLVMIAELEDGADLRTAFKTRIASHPRVAEWEALMMSLQQRAPGAGPDEWWTAMERVFDYQRTDSKA